MGFFMQGFSFIPASSIPPHQGLVSWLPSFKATFAAGESEWVARNVLIIAI
jgi:hypothetical protein